MKIIENAPDRLVIEHVPWATLTSMIGFMSLFVAVSILFIIAEIPAGAVIFLAIGAGVPALAIYIGVARSQLVFDRTTGTVDHRRRSFRGTTRQPFPLANLDRIYVGQNGPNKGRLFLEITGSMDEGHHPFPRHPAPLADIKTAHAIATEWFAP